MSDLKGVCPVISVPFNNDDEINYEDLENQIRTLSDGGCHALFLFGYASEFYKMNDEERKKLAKESVNAGDRYNIPIYISVTAQSTKTAEEWAQFYEGIGAEGLMVLPPRQAEPNEEALYKHLQSVASEVSLPIVVQYAPQQGGASIEPDVFARLSEEEKNVAYYKIECEPPGPYISTLLERTDGDVDILVGSGGINMIESFDRGATGVIPGGAMHELYLKIYESYTTGDRDAALSYHKDLLPVLNHMSQAGELFIMYEKRFLKQRDIISNGRLRAPTYESDEYLDQLADDYFEEIREHLGSQ